MFCESDGDGSGAGANIENAKRVSGRGFFCDEVEHGLDEPLGFGAGDEGVRRDAEGEAKEFLLAGEVLLRLVRGASRGESAELREVFGAERVIAVGEEEGAVALKYVREQRLGIAAGDALCVFVDGVAECAFVFH
jgi:hypothetical protein